MPFKQCFGEPMAAILRERFARAIDRANVPGQEVKQRFSRGRVRRLRHGKRAPQTVEDLTKGTLLIFGRLAWSAGPAQGEFEAKSRGDRMRPGVGAQGTTAFDAPSDGLELLRGEIVVDLCEPVARTRDRPGAKVGQVVRVPPTNVQGMDHAG